MVDDSARPSRKLTVLSIAVIGVAVCAAAGYFLQGSILEQWYLGQLESAWERGIAAEKLVMKCREGDLSQKAVDRICEILAPRLRSMSDGMKRGESHTGMFVSELDLAWALATLGRLPAEQTATFIEHLDPSWCDFTPQAPSRLELRGVLRSPPPGLVVHHVVRIKAVDTQPRDEVALETFLCVQNEAVAGRRWSIEKVVNISPQPIKRLSVEKRSVYYMVPADGVHQLPKRATEREGIEQFKSVLTSESARKLCEFSKTGELKKRDTWRFHF